MNCAHCQRTNDEEAIFCVYCGVRMDVLVAPAASRPATGATIDLGRPAAPRPEAAKPVPPPDQRPSAAPRPQPGPAARPAAPTVTWQPGQHPPHAHRPASPVTWLPFLVFGLVFAVLFKHFWIMAVIMMLCWIGHNADRKAAGCDRKHHGGSGMIWLIGIPILFFTGWWWPGIMILIGLSALKH